MPLFGFRAPPLLFGQRGAVCILALTLTLAARSQPAGDSEREAKTFLPKYNSLKEHPLPEWFEDAKLGIFIHWGIYSVPAFAPPSEQFGKLSETEFFKRNPYAEWYFNSMRIEGTETRSHHQRVYGLDYDYYRFAEHFNRAIERWDPGQTAEILASVHAKYVVLTTKHHDGFTLWPSSGKNPNRPEAQSRRDVVGELTAAVKARGLRAGVYYSGGIDWTFHPVLIDGPKEGSEVTPGGDYPAYADAHLKELISRYRPSVLWNDIRYPESSGLLKIVADFYNENPEGVINDRWGRWMWSDFTTSEYSAHPRISEKKWEATRGIGNSFGYNHQETAEHMLSVDELVDSFIDIVSKNGNLLLNVGPRADGTIPDVQLERLKGLGRWLDVNGAAIFGTRPWVDFRGTVGESTAEIRFTYRAASEKSQNVETVYAFVLSKPTSRTITLKHVVPSVTDTRVHLLGNPSPLNWRRVGDDLQIELPADIPDSPAHTLSISPEPLRLMSKDN